MNRVVANGSADMDKDKHSSEKNQGERKRKNEDDEQSSKENCKTWNSEIDDLFSGYETGDPVQSDTSALPLATTRFTE